MTEQRRPPHAWVEDYVNRAFWRGFYHGIALGISGTAFAAIAISIYLGNR